MPANGVFVEPGVPILATDHDLARELGQRRATALYAELVADVVHVGGRRWDPRSLHPTIPANLGLLVLDGFLEREVEVAGRCAAELLGPGDLLRPWDLEEEENSACVPVRWSWTVLRAARLAILDQRTATAAGRCPRLIMALETRAMRRSRELVVLLAISQIRQIERRVLTLAWHLADRFGRVTSDGVLLPLPLKHTTVAKLVAAARPTVTTAVGDLVARGDLERLAGGQWLLKGRPPHSSTRDGVALATTQSAEGYGSTSPRRIA